MTAVERQVAKSGNGLDGIAASHASIEMLPATDFRLVMCRCGHHRVGLLLEDVDEVVPMAKLESLPEAPDWIRGVLNLRGEALPVIDAQSRLTQSASEVKPFDLILVCQANGKRVGLAVPEVFDLVRIPAGASRSLDEDIPCAAYILGIVQHEDLQILVLSPSRLAGMLAAVTV